MRVRDVVLHAASGAWAVRRRWDTWAATGALAATAFACVAAFGIGTAIEEVVERELDRARPDLGILVVKPASVGTGRAVMARAREIVEGLRDARSDSAIEAVSVLYLNPMARALGLLPVGPDGQPYGQVADEVTWGVAVADDDPLVLPGFGLPASATAPFARGGGGMPGVLRSSSAKRV